MWLEKLKELKRKSGLTIKQIAEKKNLSEKTVERIFSGKTDHPYMDTLSDIVSVLGGSLDDLFSNTHAQLASGDLISLQRDVDRLTKEIENLQAQLKHKDEIISLHERYLSIIDGTHK